MHYMYIAALKMHFPANLAGSIGSQSGQKDRTFTRSLSKEVPNALQQHVDRHQVKQQAHQFFRRPDTAPAEQITDASILCHG